MDGSESCIFQVNVSWKEAAKNIGRHIQKEIHF